MKKSITRRNFGGVVWALSLLLASVVLSVSAMPADTHDLQPRQYTSQAYWYSKCLPVLVFLRSHGAPESQLFDKLPENSKGCCDFDSSDSTHTRKITCVNGVLDTITWSGDLTGDINLNGFADPSLQDATKPTPATAIWTMIDLSNNPQLTGTVPRWLRGAGNTLRTLNLSNTNVVGQVPRLDILLPNLVSLDLSRTAISGYLPPLPAKVVQCSTAANRGGLCNYPVSGWLALTPPACYAGLPPCSGNAPDASAPVIPAILTPHWGDLAGPYSQYGMKSTQEQCDLLRSWFKFHQLRDETLWPAGSTCCDHEIVKCDRWGVIWVFGGALGLKGDINLPANTIQELKGLQYVFFDRNALTGTFPPWIPTLSDLYNLDLSFNQLLGPFPQLSQCSQIKNVELQGNRFNGKIPVLVSRNSTYFCSCGNFLGACKFEGGNTNLCWEHDPEFYDSTCITSNPSIKQCPGDGTSVTDYIPPVAPDVATKWTCIKSCDDFGRYLNIKQMNSIPAKIQCDGPNSTACSWYMDAECSILAPNEEEPRGSGVVCTQYAAGWCAVAAFTLANPNAIESTCGATGPWTCVQSCIDKGNSLKVRSVGTENKGGTVQCQGPDATKCSWFAGPGCRTLAPGEPEPHSSGEAGMSCTQLEAGWCNIGFEAVFHNNVSVPCTNVQGPSGASGLHCGLGTAALAAGLMAINLAV